MSFTSKSQQIGHYDSLGNVTYYTEDTIKLPYSVAKKVAKELVSYDSLKAIHQLTKEQLVLTEAKVSIKDEIIEGHVQKGIMYEDRIKNEQQKFEVQKQWIDDLRKENKKLKAKLTFTKITMSIGIGILTYLFVTK
jgi:cell shape-determining protein MreC